jgi:hypothetical protein
VFAGVHSEDATHRVKVSQPERLFNAARNFLAATPSSGAEKLKTSFHPSLACRNLRGELTVQVQMDDTFQLAHSAQSNLACSKTGCVAFFCLSGG